MGHFSEDLSKANQELSLLVEKYKQYNYTREVSPKPYPYSGVPVPFINGKVFLLNQQPFSSFPRNYKGWAGVCIGSAFGIPEPMFYTDKGSYDARKPIVNQFKAEVREILDGLKKEHKGYVQDDYGSSYSTLYWWV